MSERKLTQVLIVEDDPDIAAIGKLALEKLGQLQVDLCENGALVLAIAIDLQPDIILLDLMLPGMNGSEVLVALKQEPLTRSIPVIFLTARVQPAEIKAYRAAGVAGVIAKPFDPMTLVSEIGAIWRSRYA